MASNGVPPLSQRRRQTKLEVCEAFLENLRQRNNIDVDAPGFADGLRQHFESLPSRLVMGFGGLAMSLMPAWRRLGA